MTAYMGEAFLVVFALSCFSMIAFTFYESFEDFKKAGILKKSGVLVAIVVLFTMMFGLLFTFVL